jgi:hypothetical protein
MNRALQVQEHDESLWHLFVIELGPGYRVRRWAIENWASTKRQLASAIGSTRTVNENAVEIFSDETDRWSASNPDQEPHHARREK